MKNLKLKNKTLEWPQSPEDFIALLSLADEAYYLSEVPLIDDFVYDAIRDDFKNKYPNNPFHSKVGSPSKSSFKKEKHSIPMGSQSKVNTLDEIKTWIKNTVKITDFVWSEKLDGLSVSLEYRNGFLSRALTRGDGVEGENITVNVSKMKNVPLKISYKENLDVRGEIILSKKSFTKFFPEKSNPRNVAAGLVRRLDGVGCEHLQVFCYDLVGPEITQEKEKFQIIESLNLKTPQWGETSIDLVQDLWSDYDLKRNSLDLEMDGLILTINDIKKQKELGVVDNRPKFSRAYKFSSQSGITEIKDLTWQVGRSGRITPVAEIEPITLAGASLSRVSLHNLDELKRLNIGLNQKIKMVRSGDVIPKILETLSKGDPLVIPDTCPSCSTKTTTSSNGTFLLCESLSCPEKMIQETIYFISTLKIDGVGEELVKQLFLKELIKNPWDIFALKKEDITSIPRQGVKSAQNALSEIKKSKDMSPEIFLSSLGIPNLAKETAKILIKTFGTIEKTLEASLDELIAIKGVGAKTSETFFLEFENKKTDILDYLSKVKIQYKANSSEGKLSGSSFCFTGFRDKDLEGKIVELGGEILSGVSKNLTHLVCLDKTKKSSKIDKALKLGIAILEKSELEGMV